MIFFQCSDSSGHASSTWQSSSQHRAPLQSRSTARASDHRFLELLHCARILHWWRLETNHLPHLLRTPEPPTDQSCKDISENLKNPIKILIVFFSNQVKPHVAPVQAAVSKKWKQFAKSDVGGKVEKIAMNIHAWIVDKWVKIQRFVQQTVYSLIQRFNKLYKYHNFQWNNVAAWWKKNGQKQFGPALEGFVLGVKMVFQVVADALRSVGGAEFRNFSFRTTVAGLEANFASTVILMGAHIFALEKNRTCYRIFWAKIATY